MYTPHCQLNIAFWAWKNQSTHSTYIVYLITFIKQSWQIDNIQKLMVYSKKMYIHVYSPSIRWWGWDDLKGSCFRGIVGTQGVAWMSEGWVHLRRTSNSAKWEDSLCSIASVLLKLFPRRTSRGLGLGGIRRSSVRNSENETESKTTCCVKHLQVAVS